MSLFDSRIYTICTHNDALHVLKVSSMERLPAM
jgi:hypothetical protein